MSRGWNESFIGINLGKLKTKKETLTFRQLDFLTLFENTVNETWIVAVLFNLCDL